MILLSHFSSLLEVVTAIYISMCMDDVLRGVWSPKYYEDLAKALKDYYIEGHDELVNRIVETNREKADSISMYMKNRAAFLAVITMLFILLLGYESAYQNNSTMLANIGMMMVFLVISSILVILCNSISFSTKQHTASSIFLAVVLTSILTLANGKWFRFSIEQSWIANIIIFLIILPILWQVFVCWMFSSAYKGYIRRKLQVGKRNYELAKKGLEEHNETIIPKRYLALYQSESIRSNNAEEAKNRCLDNYLELMEDEISQASDPRSVFKIFCSWTRFHAEMGLMRLAVYLGLKKDNTISQQQ